MRKAGKMGGLAIDDDLGIGSILTAALQESETHYRLLTDNIRDVIWAGDLNLRHIYVSPSITGLAGYSVEEFMGKQMEEILTLASFEMAKMALAEELVIQNTERNDPPKSQTLELEMSCKDGSTVWTEAKMTFFLDSNGHPIGVAGVIRDITERRRMEEELRESEEFLQVLFNSVLDGVLILDYSGKVLSLNSALAKMFGLESISDGIGRNALEFILPEFQDAVIKDLANVKEGRGGYLNSYKVRAVSGEEFWVEGLGTDMIYQGKHVDIVSIRDISERKRAEDEKELMSAQLLQAQKMESIGTLAGGIAHDFNNVITAIKGYTEVAMMEVDEAGPLHKYLKGIDAACSNAAGLTSQLLLFGRKNPMQAVPVDINEVARNVQQMLKRLLREDIAIEAYLEPDIFTMQADPGNIEQVIMNLAINARDAMPEGGKLTLMSENVILSKKHCQPIPGARPGSYVCLSVADTGTGIDKEIIPYIFEPFFSTKEAGKGSGLGLAVVYGIVKAHNGWIDVHSEHGQGTTFKLYLPAVPGSPEGKDDETMSPEQIRANGERILLVEDDRGVREFVNEALSKNGYVVFEAASARDALKVFDSRKGDFHLAFIDVVLPDMSGFQLVDQIHSRSPELPVLLGSGYLHDKLEWPVIHERRCQILQKPYNLGEVLRAVRATIGAAQV